MRDVIQVCSWKLEFGKHVYFRRSGYQSHSLRSYDRWEVGQCEAVRVLLFHVVRHRPEPGSWRSQLPVDQMRN